MERYEFSSDRRGFPRILSGYPVDLTSIFLRLIIVLILGIIRLPKLLYD